MSAATQSGGVRVRHEFRSGYVPSGAQQKRRSVLLGPDSTLQQNAAGATLRLRVQEVQAHDTPSRDASIRVDAILSTALGRRPWPKPRGLHCQMVLLNVLHRPAPELRTGSPGPVLFRPV